MDHRWWMVWLTAAAVIAAGLSAAVYTGQLNVMSNQLGVLGAQRDLMEAQQRPWIKLLTSSPAPDWGLIFEDRAAGGAELAFSVIAENVGAVVANDVFVQSVLAMTVPEGGSWNGPRPSISHQQEILCDRVREGKIGPRPLQGRRVMFPGETVEFKQIARLPNFFINLPESAKFYLVGCVNYRSNVIMEHRQTRFSFLIKLKGSEPHQYTIDTGENIVGEKLQFLLAGYGNNVD